jgi:hypothetical protein
MKSERTASHSEPFFCHSESSFLGPKRATHGSASAARDSRRATGPCERAARRPGSLALLCGRDTRSFLSPGGLAPWRLYPLRARVSTCASQAATGMKHARSPAVPR